MTFNNRRHRSEWLEDDRRKLIRMCESREPFTVICRAFPQRSELALRGKINQMGFKLGELRLVD